MKSLKVLISITLLALLFLITAIPAVANIGEDPDIFAMFVNGKQVGIVKFPARALLIYDKLENEIKEDFHQEVYIGSKIHFKGINSKQTLPTNENTLIESIRSAMDIKIESFAVNIDGTKVCHVKTLNEAQKLVEDIKAPYVHKVEEKDDRQLEDVAFKQEIDFDEELTPPWEIISVDDAKSLILFGGEELREYRVKEGDSLWQIAYQNDITLGELMTANPDLDEDDFIQIGDIVRINQEKRLLNVITKEKFKYSADIPYETETKEDRSLAQGKTKILQNGETGQKDIVALVTKEDGQEVSFDILEETIVKEPVKQIEAVGTKVPPRPKSTVTKTPSGTNNGSGGSTAVSRSGSTTGSDVVAYAKKFLGTRYVYGGSSPGGFDCSGFTKYVFGHFGVSLPHSAGAQRSYGASVSRANLRAGDLVFFSGHVGIYVGNDQFIHAPQPGDVVKIASLSARKKKPMQYATRIFK